MTSTSILEALIWAAPGRRVAVASGDGLKHGVS